MEIERKIKKLGVILPESSDAKAVYVLTTSKNS